MADFTMTIDGSPVGGACYPVVNPATAEVFAQAPACAPAQLDQAMAAAARAYPGWKRDDGARQAVLRQAAGLILASVGELAPLLTAEQGKPRSEAATEVRAAGAWLRYYADLEIPREVVQDDRRGFAEVVHRPLGVVAAITPWNYPIALALWKIAPALRAGNTMVLKPSPFTPLATLALGRLLSEVLPAGVLNVISGPDPLGALLAGHPTPRKISFTGSAATGRRVAAAAAADLKRVTLELGGNDPAIVLEDADPEAIADALFWGAFANNGQMCMAVKRVYVAQRRCAEVVAALAERARTVRVGDGSEKASQLGPISNRAQFDRVRELVRDALAHGAVAAAGGAALDRPGHFFAPTILSGVSDGVRVVDEEQFGPVLPVIGYRDIDEAVRRANGTDYGLTASVWSPDLDRAAAVAARLEAGQVSVNAHAGAVRPDLPFSGHKESGIGVENGLWGLYGYTDVQALTRPAIGAEPVPATGRAVGAALARAAGLVTVRTSGGVRLPAAADDEQAAFGKESNMTLSTMPAGATPEEPAATGIDGASPTAPPAKDPTSAARLADLADYVVPFTLRAICDLRIADHLADGPRTVEQLAQLTGSHALSLHRALRALASRDIFTEVEPGVFGLTALAEPLRSDHPASLRDAYPLIAGDIRAWSAFDHTLRTGEPAFDHVHGQGYWEHLAEHPRDSALFDASQRSVTRRELRAILPAYDWSVFGAIVDVGGGNGAFLAGILDANPSVRGILFDQPHVVAAARSVLVDRGVVDRCEVVGGDFLESVPAGGDAYLLKRVLYAWNDEQAVAMLRAIRAGMHADSRLLLLEPVLEPGNEFDWGKLYDVLLLVMAGGGGRSLESLQELFAKADLELVRVIRTRMLPIVEARPI